jgi:hypothetical protein
MEDLLRVDVLDGHTELGEPIEDLDKDIRGSLNTKLYLL